MLAEPLTILIASDEILIKQHPEIVITAWKQALEVFLASDGLKEILNDNGKKLLDDSENIPAEKIKQLSELILEKRKGGKNVGKGEISNLRDIICSALEPLSEYTDDLGRVAELFDKEYLTQYASLSLGEVAGGDSENRKSTPTEIAKVFQSQKSDGFCKGRISLVRMYPKRERFFRNDGSLCELMKQENDLIFGSNSDKVINCGKEVSGVSFIEQSTGFLQESPSAFILCTPQRYDQIIDGTFSNDLRTEIGGLKSKFFLIIKNREDSKDYSQQNDNSHLVVGEQEAVRFLNSFFTILQARKEIGQEPADLNLIIEQVKAEDRSLPSSAPIPQEAVSASTTKGCCQIF